MLIFYGFRRAFSVLLASFIAVPLLFPAVSMAQTRPVIVTITQLEQLGDDFDPFSLGDFYAHVTINGTTHSTLDDRFFKLPSPC
jgi:hypothetical protein